NPAILGDVFNDQLSGQHSDGTPTESGTYLGLAFNAANASSGVLVKGNDDGFLYYLTNVPLTNVTGSNNQLTFQLQDEIVGEVPSAPTINTATGTPSETFSFVYQVSYDPSTNNLHASGSDLTGPLLSDIITDDIPNGPNDNPSILGDVFNDQLTGVASDGSVS